MVRRVGDVDRAVRRDGDAARVVELRLCGGNVFSTGPRLAVPRDGRDRRVYSMLQRSARPIVSDFRLPGPAPP